MSIRDRCILMPVGSNILGRVRNSDGLRKVMLLASALLGLQYINIALLAQRSTLTFLLTLIFAGLFAGILFAGDTVAIMDSLEPEKVASGLAALSMVRQVSAVVGIASIGTVSEIIANYSNSEVNGRLWGIGISGVLTFGAWISIKYGLKKVESCLLYTSPSPRDLSTSRMPSSA